MAAKASERASVLTTLKIGELEIAVGLFNAHADPKKKLVEFDTAGPNGGVLKARQQARPTPVGEATDRPAEGVVGDPLAAEGAPPTHMLAGAELLDGEYARELVEEGTGEVVAPEAVRRGVRLENGAFVDCTAQLTDIEEKTKLDRMEVVGFLDISRIPRARVKGAYYVGAGDERAPKALRLVLEALKRTRRCAAVKLTKRSRQSLAVIGWLGGVLVLYELVWAENFREPPARARLVEQAQVTGEQVARACELVRAMSEAVDSLDDLRDDAIRLREELHAKALAGKVEPVEPPEPEPEESDLMRQLEQSLAGVA